MTSETLADIVAEMRELAADIAAGNAVVGQTVWRNYADRIDEAAKRLREDEYHRGAEAREKFIYAVLGKPSNAAAMREALEFVKRYLRLALQVCGDYKYFPGCMNVAANRCSDSLATPPRNCDLFSSYSEACDYWHEHVECVEINGCFDVWLFEPATEQKGETDGSK